MGGERLWAILMLNIRERVTGEFWVIRPEPAWGPATGATTLPRAGQPTGFQELSWLQADLQLHQGFRRVPFSVWSTCDGRELSRWKPGSSYHSFSFSIVVNNFKIVWGRGKRWGGRERARVLSELKVDALGEPRTPGWGGELRPLNRST